MIPLCDVQQQYRALKSEIDAAVLQVLADGQYVLGPNVQVFEREVAEYLGCRYAIGVGNGTDALHLSLRALNIGPGDEVITTPLTFIATSEAIALVGATPVFADVDPFTYNIDAAAIEEAITPRTRAILPVHLFGQPCNMGAIMQIAILHGLHVVEDCAQAMGATFGGRHVGTFGTAGCFSFFPTKNLGGCGDGGLITTDDPQFYQRVEKLRRHGTTTKYHHSEVGLNSRLDELQAAILRVKLRHLESQNEGRRQCAYRYNRLLAGNAEVTRPAELARRAPRVPTVDAESELLRAVYHQYTILCANRDRVRQSLQAAGIGNAVYYPLPLHLQEAHAELGHQAGDFPVAEAISKTCLSLPMFAELSQEQQKAVCRALAAAVVSAEQTAMDFAVSSTD
jgi:dTDP-4-amino-4,6-dideoxygalactose transaminase